jgi:Ca2+-binding EF-hand superfamily protein
MNNFFHEEKFTQERNEKLLNCIRWSSIRGIFHIFIDVLRETEQSTLAEELIRAEMFVLFDKKNNDQIFVAAMLRALQMLLKRELLIFLIKKLKKF